MKSLLIVDDNLVSLKQISAQLAKFYDVSLAKSGELAMQICAQEKPDLILLDVEMPEMDGFETLARLKADPQLKNIPVIFLTGNHDAATEVKCLGSGGMDFITKPANIDILCHRIELHLQFAAYQLHQEKMVKELEDNIGISFAELLDCKDYDIADHLLRTSEYAELLTRELFTEGTFGNELKEEDIEVIKRAAPFHDVGKIGVSDIILLKRTSLTGEEYAEICKHPAIGAHVLKAIYERTPDQRYLYAAMIIAEGHHERYDGTGYPKGIKGDEIPLFCRIVSLANVYDSCKSSKIYRKGLSHDDTCRAIIAGRGTVFDPRIVDVFEKIKDKFAVLQVVSKPALMDKGWSISDAANIGG